jgi:glycogen synthase
MVDTIHDPGLGAGRAALKTANGVLLDGAGAGAMIAALHRVMELRDHQTVWRTMQRNAMREDHGWPSAVQAYLQLFAGMRGHAVVGPHRMRTRSERPAVRAGRTRVSVAPGL